MFSFVFQAKTETAAQYWP